MLFSGQGTLDELLVQAETIIGERDLAHESTWECVRDEEDFLYYVTTRLVCESVDVAELHVDTPVVCCSF